MGLKELERSVEELAGNMNRTEAELRDRVSKLEAQVEMLSRMLLGQGQGLLHSAQLPAASSDKQVASSQSEELALRTEELVNVMRGMTMKQHKILQMIFHGFKGPDMARIMESHEGTTKTIANTIRQKFKAKDRQTLISLYREAFDSMDENTYKQISGLEKDWCQGVNPK